jgi:hypothetical protein
MWYCSNKVSCTDILRNKIPVAYLFFSPSLGLLIVNLQSDARKEFNGSIARRTPQAWKSLCAILSWWRKIIDIILTYNSAERNTIDNGHKRDKTETEKISIPFKSHSKWMSFYKRTQTEFSPKRFVHQTGYYNHLSECLVPLQYFQYYSFSLWPINLIPMSKA